MDAVQQAKYAAQRVVDIQKQINEVKFLNPLTLKPLLAELGKQQAHFNKLILEIVTNG
jgi:hypothetical protein